MTDDDIAQPEFQAFALRAFETSFAQAPSTQVFDLGIGTAGGDQLDVTIASAGSIRLADGSIDVGACAFRLPAAATMPVDANVDANVDVLLAKHDAFRRFAQVRAASLRLRGDQQFRQRLIQETEAGLSQHGANMTPQKVAEARRLIESLRRFDAN